MAHITIPMTYTHTHRDAFLKLVEIILLKTSWVTQVEAAIIMFEAYKLEVEEIPMQELDKAAMDFVFCFELAMRPPRPQPDWLKAAYAKRPIKHRHQIAAQG